MIAHLSGLTTAVMLDGAVVDVGGVGLLVHCGPNTVANLRVGETTRLATSLVVREDSLTLYGFASDDERALFELLQTASGVGPRLAQAILAALAPDKVRTAIATGDISALTQVSGIGKKGAERLILELKDRVGPPVGASGTSPSTSGQRGHAQVIAGLTALGWSTQQSEQAVRHVVSEHAADPSATEAELSVPVLLKQAITLLGRGSRIN